MLGSARRKPSRNPRDGRIVRLGIHRTDDARLGSDIKAAIWVRAVDADWHELAWLRAMSAAPTVHCATCHTISGTSTHARIWTGPYIKACADNAATLQRWLEANIGLAPRPFGRCAR